MLPRAVRPASRALRRLAVALGVAAVPAMLAAAAPPASAAVAADCVAGEYFDADTETCVPAEVGFYTDEGGLTAPVAIPLGSEGTGGAEDGTGSTGIADCEAGTYRGDAATTFCVDAEAGRIVAEPGASASTPCEAGTFQAEAGRTACDPAPAGSFVGSEGATAATLCAAGSFSASTGASACTPAAVGSYVSGTGATAQVAIPLGSEGTGGASDGTGSTGTDECEAGSYRGDEDTTSCVDAAVGFYVASAGATAQVAIPLGSEGTGGASDGTGSTGTDECEAGSYRGDEDTTSCVDAAPGSFVATAEATAATTCPKGTFQPDAGQTSCDDAPAGSHVPVTGATAAALCEPGTYSDAPGAEACTPAAVGYYVPRPGATTQLRCITAEETGLSRCPVPTSTPSDDTDDEELAVGDEPLSAQGDPCEPGTWSATGTSRAGVSCTPASPGTFVADAGATAEEPCPAGTFSDTFGATACTPAPVGSYVATTGAMDPAPCPGATEPGATECPETVAAPEAQSVVEPDSSTSVGWWIGGLVLVLAAGGAGFVLVQRRTGILTASVDGAAGAGPSTLTRLRGLDTTAAPAAPAVPPAPEVLEWDEALDGRPDDDPPPQPLG